MIGLPGAGDPLRHVLLHQAFERAEIYDLEEDKRLGIVLQPDQHIALDVAELQRWKTQSPVRYLSISIQMHVASDGLAAAVGVGALGVAPVAVAVGGVGAAPEVVFGGGGGGGAARNV